MPTAARDRRATGRGGTGTLLSSPADARRSACPPASRRSNRSHSSSTREPDARRAASSICVARQQRGVVQRVAGDRQPPALDRVGEHDARPVGHLVARPVRSRASRPRSWPPRFCTSGDEVVVGDLGERSGAPTSSAPRRNAGAARAPRSANSDWYSSFDMSSMWRAQRVAARAGEGRLQQAAVLRLDDVPAGAVEELHQLLDLLVRGSRGRGSGGSRRRPTSRCRAPAATASAIASHTLPSSSSASPTSAMKRAGRSARLAEVGVDVAARRRRRTAARRRRGRPSRSRSRRRRGPWSGSGTPAARRARAGGCRYDRSSSPIRYLMAWNTGDACGLTATLSSPFRWPNHSDGHDPDHRRRRRLVPADLASPRPAARPLAVGVVDHPHRQPQDAALDPLQRVSSSVMRPSHHDRGGVGSGAG